MKLRKRQRDTIVAALRYLHRSADGETGFRFKLRLCELCPQDYGFGSNNHDEPLDDGEFDLLCDLLCELPLEDNDETYPRTADAPAVGGPRTWA